MDLLYNNGPITLFHKLRSSHVFILEGIVSRLEAIASRLDTIACVLLLCFIVIHHFELNLTAGVSSASGAIAMR